MRYLLIWQYVIAEYFENVSLSNQRTTPTTSVHMQWDSLRDITSQDNISSITAYYIHKKTVDFLIDFLQYVASRKISKK